MIKGLQIKFELFILKASIDKFNSLKEKYQKQDFEHVLQISKMKQYINGIFLVEILLRDHKMIYEKLI